MSIEQTAQLIQFAYPQVYLACHTRHQRKRTSTHRVSPRDATILAHLQRDFSTTPARLAEHLGIARSTLSEALKRLMELGFIERPAGKTTGVVLTARGADVIRADSVLEWDRLHAVLETLTNREMKAVADGMTALAAGCERLARRTATRKNASRQATTRESNA